MLNTIHKRKSAVITAVILILFVFGIFNYGMHYLDPPEEYGLAINFGTSEVGSGEPVEDTKKISAPEVVEEEVVEKEVVEEVAKETPQEVVKEDIITEETVEDVPVVEKVKEAKKEPVKKVVEKKKEVKKPVKKEVKKEIPKEQPKPKPSKATQDALNNLLNGNSSDGKPQGEGDDNKAGVKGKETGDPSSSKYYGNTGGGSGGDGYDLKGRRALSKPKEQPDCQEEGTVVVRIKVDKNGKVISAQPGARGTTNSAPCLFKPARAAALRTKWNPDDKAPANQVGTIIYKFSLSK